MNRVTKGATVLCKDPIGGGVGLSLF
jgi:hypothetical protein